MDFLDVVIIVFLVFFAYSGLRRGLSGVAVSLAGLGTIFGKADAGSEQSWAPSPPPGTWASIFSQSS